MNIKEKLQVLQQELQQANEQINEWNAVRLKKIGAIEALSSMVEPEPETEKES